MPSEDGPRSHERWAHLRFSIVGGLLASPPQRGELSAELLRLAAKTWRHPRTGQPVRFGLSTIERWYYAALEVDDPVRALERKLRADSGAGRVFTDPLAALLRAQYVEHPSWSYKLHLDNLAARVSFEARPGTLPSYATLRRYMLAHNWLRQPRKRGRHERSQATDSAHERREVRSFESAYVNGLWHLDFHQGSLGVLTPKAGWKRPHLLAILDDRSRLICHAQWYLDETAESLTHALVQAFLKRGLPRSLMSDNGSAMTAAETTQGLKRLSIAHVTTLPYSPYQNGKQEVFWAQVEGRLMAMLERQRDLSLGLLNQATQAWIEMEYQHAIHSETGQAPLQRWLAGPTVAREAPSLDELRLALTAASTRRQRQSDGTLSLAGVRFELPARFRHLHTLHVRFAHWDLSHVWLLDEHTGTLLARLYPLDKTRNADALRRPIEPSPAMQPPVQGSGIAPLLRKLMAEYAATGLPPAYIPKEDM